MLRFKLKINSKYFKQRLSITQLAEILHATPGNQSKVMITFGDGDNMRTTIVVDVVILLERGRN
jgi:hypothetical protein